MLCDNGFGLEQLYANYMQQPARAYCLYSLAIYCIYL